MCHGGREKSCLVPRLVSGLRGRMNTLLRLFLEKYMQLGQLTVVSARGEEIRLGDGSGPPVAVRFNTARAERAWPRTRR